MERLHGGGESLTDNQPVCLPLLGCLGRQTFWCIVPLEMTTILLLHLGSGVLLVLLSLPLLWGKVPPNGLYGFRTRATLGDPAIWYPANKYAARRLIGSGMALAGAAVILRWIPGLSVDAYALGCLGVFAVPFVLGLVQSVLYANRLVRARDPLAGR